MEYLLFIMNQSSIEPQIVFLGIPAIIFLFIFLPQWKNAVWGGATLGLIVGVVWGVISGESSHILMSVSYGVWLGFLFEVTGMLGDFLKGLRE